jgi:DMSO reductase family type II enzyme chaperone
MGKTVAPDARISIARAVIYRVLARCYSYPDVELLELFENARAEEISQSLCCLGLSAETMTSVTDWLAGCRSREAALMELEKDFIRLFARPYPETLIQPYSSVYLDEQRRVWGASTAEAARLYEAAGLGMSKDFHDLPDHIAVELEFASYLIGEQQKGATDNNSAVRHLAAIEKRFLVEHLFRWAPAFFSRVSEQSRSAFYGTTALMGHEFVDWDIQHPDGGPGHRPVEAAEHERLASPSDQDAVAGPDDQRGSQPPDAHVGRRQHDDPGVQDVPGGREEGMTMSSTAHGSPVFPEGWRAV